MSDVANPKKTTRVRRQRSIYQVHYCLERRCAEEMKPLVLTSDLDVQAYHSQVAGHKNTDQYKYTVVTCKKYSRCHIAQDPLVLYNRILQCQNETSLCATSFDFSTTIKALCLKYGTAIPYFSKNEYQKGVNNSSSLVVRLSDKHSVSSTDCHLE
ncbi:unnamed protein product [Diatraea saccharalis]|uniref:Uncharacterized protein n=1 Tax=Diatraea saccharalis TaxID=40085 RepID=A0A9N9R2Y8_9NEOP|nr:unnamed protein product [Diatraea saccharalis]